MALTPAYCPFALELLLMRALKSPVSVLVVALTLLSSACSSSDSTDAKMPTATASTTATTGALTLTSPSFQAGSALPNDFTCAGKAFGDGASPALNWSNEPTGTLSYAIVLKDLTIEAGQSAGDMNPEHPFHWTIWNIPSANHGLSASLATTQSPLTGAQQQNGGPPFISPGAYGYFGPCPNLGAAGLGAAVEVHNDVFILYAFSDAVLTPPAYDPGPDAAKPLNPVRQLANFFEAHPKLLGKAELKFTSDAKPSTCAGFPNPPFTCAPAASAAP
jgi:phosphatidylethanolamine-binding protein (PEBP) family uncharacterized protein